MKSYLKSVILILALSVGMVRTDDALMLSAFTSGYPNNMQYGNIYSDHAKLCICGLHTEILGPLGSHMEMYRLAQSAWNWEDAEEKKRQNNWSNIAVTNAFIGGAMWYSPGDASFVTYVLPAKMMKSVIDAWVEIIAQGEVEATAGECTPYISYFAANWYEILVKNNKTKEERAAFTEQHNVDKYWEYEEKGKFKMAYPDDFTGIKKNWLKGAEGKQSPKWLEVKQFPRVNAIVCEVSAKRKNQQGDLVDQPGNIVYSDYLTGYKMFIHKGKALKYENGFEAANKLEMIGEKTALSKMMMISNRAFMWEEDYKTIDKKDSGAVIENLVLPNTFEYQICQNILNPKSYGDFFAVSTSEWDKIWEYYKWNCPMIAFRGPLGYYVPDKEAGKKWLKRIPMIDKDSENLFPMEPGAGKVINNMKDYSIDPSKVEFKKSDTFDGILEAAKKGDEEAEADRKEQEDKAKEEASESVDSEIKDQPKPTGAEIHDALEQAKQEFDSENTGEDEGEGEGEGSENESQDSSDKSYEEVVELPEPIIIKIKTCEERRKEIEELLQDKVPKTEREAAMMVNLMMSHPHLHDCREFSKFQFNFNDNGGSVLNIEPEAVVVNWRVKRVNPFKYDPKQKDPTKVVFEVIFFNHYYEDQKDALYYIPAREVVNEWDKFPGILVDFEDFVIDRMGDILTVPMAYEKFKRYITTQFTENSSGWSINDTASGPSDLAGNSSAYEFQMVFDDPNANYILHFFRIDSGTERGYFDFIFQCWRIGEKYLMLKINGTQYNYSVLINIYSNEEKLNEIWTGIYKTIFDQFVGDSGIVSLRQIKQIIYNKMSFLAASKYKFGFELNQIPIPGDEYDDPVGGHENMISSDHTNFLYNFLATDVDVTVIVRGFVHFRENISVLNLYFSTDMFESEYIIPLDNEAVFTGYIEDIFNECYMHMYMLLDQISIVENEDTTEEQLDAEQKLGRYSMKKLLITLVHMLTDRIVYGCVDAFSIPASEMAYNDDGTPAVMTSLDDLDDSDANKRVYKWTVTEPDNTGELLLRRSNRLYRNIGVSRCTPAEKMNPVLLHLYPTRLDDRNGYALTINHPSLDGSKDIKTTYHFVKYQDYAHMRVFEKFIAKIMNQMFDFRMPEEKKDDQAE